MVRVKVQVFQVKFNHPYLEQKHTDESKTVATSDMHLDQ